MPEYDLHIKGGTVVDGTTIPRFRGDVWIKDGRIAKIGGRPDGPSDDVIDAEGMIVAPGFVDLHTHYDGQIRWDPWCTISGWHGVTSVVLGNCGFGFAPCKPEFRERSMLTMSRTEAIAIETLREGLLPHWDWETIPEYLDSLEAAPMGVNCLQYMPTASLMTYVMGLEAAKSRPANPAEIAEMQRLLHEGMDAGLCGFSIQRLGPQSVQGDYDGTPMVTDTMADEDIFALAEVLRERGDGFIQITQETGAFTNDPVDLEFKRRLAEVAQRPVLDNTIIVSNSDPSVHETRLEFLADCWAEGLQMYGQGATLRTGGFAFTLEDWNLYDSSPAWKEATLGTAEEKLARMADPELRARIKKDSDTRGTVFQKDMMASGGPIKRLIVAGVNRQPELSHYSGQTLGMIADAEDKHYIDVMLDIAIATDLKAEFMASAPAAFNVDHMAAQIVDSPYTFPGVSDGGAHTKFFVGGAFTTDFLRWLVRDEKRISLEQAHYRLSALPAHAAGFRNRGVLREGSPADVVVYSLEDLDVEPDWVGEVVHDLPGNQWRRIQRAKGYRAIIVNGEITFDEGKCTGATPGRLLRNGRG